MTKTEIPNTNYTSTCLNGPTAHQADVSCSGPFNYKPEIKSLPTLNMRAGPLFSLILYIDFNIQAI